MIIRKIGIDGFGKFHKTAFEFQPGINVIYGENEAGKTTCEQFLIGMLYDVEKLRGKGAKHDAYNRYYPEYGGKYGGVMEFFCNGIEYRVQRQFKREQKEIDVYELGTGKEIQVEKELYDTCSFMNKEQYMETFCMNSGQIQVGTYLKEELNRYSHRMFGAGTTQFDTGQAIRTLMTKKRRNQKKQTEEQLIALKTELGAFDTLEEQKKELMIQEQKLESQLKQLKVEEGNKEQQLTSMNIELQKTRQEKQKLKQWLAYDDVENEEMEEEDTGHDIHMPLIALVCFFAGFASIWQDWILVGIIMIALGIVLLLFTIFRKQTNKDLLETRNMVQLEDETQQLNKTNEEKRKEIVKEKQLLENQIIDCEKQLFDNRIQQKYLLEKEQNAQHLRKQYQEIKQEIQKTEEENRAIELAISTLQQVSASIYSEFGSSFNEEVSHIMEAITDHRYRRILIDEQMGIQVEQNGKFIGIDHVSLGTTEQIYFAIRMAAGKLFGKGERLPIMIDDVFGSFDEQRLGRTLSFLSECGHPQVFLFTCNRRIRDILINQRIDFSYLEL